MKCNIVIVKSIYAHIEDKKRGIMPKIETTSMRARKQYFSHRLFKLKATRAHESFHISIL